MPAPAHPSRSLIVNIPVADLERSKAFFLKLGFGLDPRASQEGSSALIVFGDEASVMLSSRESFAEYAHLPAGDPATHALALYTFTVASRDEVDAVSATALAEGAREADGAEDFGFMYTRSFFDLDGHGWQVMWMNPAAAEQGPEAFATSTQDADIPA
jgi:predicted lactoylglutathione lyase